MVPSLFHPAGSLASVWSPIVAAALHHFKGGVGEGGPKYKTTAEPTFQPCITCMCSTNRSVSPDMLFLGLFIASNLKIYLETLAGIWNGYIWPSISEDYAFVKWTVCLYSIGICLVIVIITISHIFNWSFLPYCRYFDLFFRINYMYTFIQEHSLSYLVNCARKTCLVDK
jgi:hypothetical protein